MQTISLLIFNLEFTFKFWCLREKLCIFALAVTPYPVFLESGRTGPKWSQKFWNRIVRFVVFCTTWLSEHPEYFCIVITSVFVWYFWKYSYYARTSLTRIKIHCCVIVYVGNFWPPDFSPISVQSLIYTPN